jgi:hypothetical protein
MSSAESFFEDIEKDEEIGLLIHDILQNFDQEIDKIWLESLEVPLTVDAAMGKVEKLVALATCFYDGELTESALEVLVPDDEPVAASVDIWARGKGVTLFCIFTFTIFTSLIIVR